MTLSSANHHGLFKKNGEQPLPWEGEVQNDYLEANKLPARPRVPPATAILLKAWESDLCPLSK